MTADEITTERMAPQASLPGMVTGVVSVTDNIPCTSPSTMELV